jgi:hypothetical protein
LPYIQIGFSPAPEQPWRVVKKPVDETKNV